MSLLAASSSSSATQVCEVSVGTDLPVKSGSRSRMVRSAPPSASARCAVALADDTLEMSSAVLRASPSQVAGGASGGGRWRAAEPGRESVRL
eukprot:scaffold80297_cov30-Tisochrysis_lutea.AAC.4